MFTPSTYTHEQIIPIIKQFVSAGGRFYHQTKIQNLASIIKHQAIFSLGTIWAKDPVLRQNLSPKLAHVSADAGLIDYVFLSTLNRLTHNSAFHSIRSDLYGELVIEVDPELLLRRDFFIFPFNVGYDWNNPDKSQQKASDISSMKHAFRSTAASIEVLVRRKVPIESFRTLYYPEKHGQLVDSAMRELAKVRRDKADAVSIERHPIKTMRLIKDSRPTFGIDILYNGERHNLGVNDLHYSSLERDDLIFFVEKQSGCICEFLIIDEQVCDPFEPSRVYGHIEYQSRIPRAA